MTPAPVCVCGGDRCNDARVGPAGITCGRLADALAIARTLGWRPPAVDGRRAAFTDEQRREAVEMVRGGMSFAEVSRATGVKATTLHSWTAQAGVRSRDWSPARAAQATRLHAAARARRAAKAAP